MASEILGLFTTPEQYQQNQLAQFQNRAAREVQLDPFQQAALGARTAGYQLGQGIGGALGGQDPQLQLIARRQQLLSQLDQSDPTSYAKVAKMASDAGDQELAFGIANAGREAAVKIAQANKERQLAVPADIQKAQMIPQIQDAIDQYKALPVSPERDRAIKLLENQLKVLLPEPKVEKTPDALQVAKRVAEIKTQLSPDTGVNLPPQVRAGLEAELGNLEKQQKENIIDVGVAEKTREVVYFDKERDQQFIMKPDATGKLVRTPYSGGIDKITAKVSASSTSQGETEFSKELGKADAKKVESAMVTRDNSIGALNSLNRLNQLNQNDLISGTFATGRLGATNLLSTLGLASGKDVDRLSASENYQKTAGDVILATLGGKLGAGFSNEDRRFIQSLVPQLENSPQARKQLIEFMVGKNQSIVEETTRLENYARENKSLKGYVPKTPIINLQGVSGKPVSQMTRQELLDEKARLQAK